MTGKKSLAKITEEEIQAVGERIASKSCVLEIHIRQPGFRKKIESTTFLRKSGNAQNIDADVLFVSKDIINVKEISYLQKQRNEFTQWLRTMSIPGGGLTLGNGQYLMPLSIVEGIKQRIESFIINRNTLLDRFELDYHNLVTQAKTLLGGFFNEDDYLPFEVIRKKYSLDYKFVSNAVPEELDKISRKLMQQEQYRIRDIATKTASEIQEVMRELFLSVVENLSEKLGQDPYTGKFHTLPEARITNLLEFINTFTDKNILGDQDLSKVVEKAKLALAGSSIREIKTNEELRTQLVPIFDTIKQDTVPLVAARRMNLSELE